MQQGVMAAVAFLLALLSTAAGEECAQTTHHTHELHLQDEQQVVCPPKCHSLNATEDSIAVELQEGDWLVVSGCEGAGKELTLKELGVGVHVVRGAAGCWSLNVTVRPHPCARRPGEPHCSGKGSCTQEEVCACCPGFVGRWCEERDACAARPCTHGGVCVDITEGIAGSTFQCLCPHGFRGEACEEEVNLCERRPCLHNGTCRGNQSAYWCECPPGYSGRHCDAPAPSCLSSPCVHGVCEDATPGYKCYCLPGYGGEHCEFEYDECDSSPCLEGGACEDLVAGYRCHCGPGYSGRRCHTKVDLCAPNPCPPPAHCVDRGNNYSCICHHNGPGCTQQYDPCFPNPCQNGGSCWPSLDSFFCSCRPGYTGDTCEELRSPGVPLALQEEEEEAAGGVGGVAAAGVAGACLLVAGGLAACHCRVHKTYRRFTRNRCSTTDLKQDQLAETRISARNKPFYGIRKQEIAMSVPGTVVVVLVVLLMRGESSSRVERQFDPWGGRKRQFSPWGGKRATEHKAAAAWLDRKHPWPEKEIIQHKYAFKTCDWLE